MSRLLDRRANRGGRAGVSLAYRLAYQEHRDQTTHEHGRAAARSIAARAKVEDVLPADSEEEEALPSGPRWVSTPTGETILAGLRYAQLAADVVLIYGGAGLGKSLAARHYQGTAPNVIHVEMSPVTGGVLACLEEIAAAAGVADYARSPAFLHRAICRRLRGSGGLIIIDEAQELGIQALDQVRCIHDQAKVGIVLMGNEQVYAQMAGSNRAAYLDRLYSRIGKRIHLKRATEADADAIIAAWGLKGHSSRVRLREVARKPGALRVLVKVLRLSRAYCEAEGRPLDVEDVEAAWADLGGLD